MNRRYPTIKTHSFCVKGKLVPHLTILHDIGPHLSELTIVNILHFWSLHSAILNGLNLYVMSVCNCIFNVVIYIHKILQVDNFYTTENNFSHYN